jgi:hypothetical protein
MLSHLCGDSLARVDVKELIHACMTRNKRFRVQCDKATWRHVETELTTACNGTKCVTGLLVLQPKDDDMSWYGMSAKSMFLTQLLPSQTLLKALLIEGMQEILDWCSKVDKETRESFMKEQPVGIPIPLEIPKVTNVVGHEVCDPHGIYAIILEAEIPHPSATAIVLNGLYKAIHMLRVLLDAKLQTEFRVTALHLNPLSTGDPQLTRI